MHGADIFQHLILIAIHAQYRALSLSNQCELTCQRSLDFMSIFSSYFAKAYCSRNLWVPDPRPHNFEKFNVPSDKLFPHTWKRSNGETIEVKKNKNNQEKCPREPIEALSRKPHGTRDQKLRKSSSSLVNKKRLMKDSGKIPCKILQDSTLFLQQTCKKHITLARILQETKNLSKDVSRSGNETFQVLVLQVVLKKIIIKSMLFSNKRSSQNFLNHINPTEKNDHCFLCL